MERERCLATPFSILCRLSLTGTQGCLEEQFLPGIATYQVDGKANCSVDRLDASEPSALL